jgi:hypothetical protein
MPLASFLITLPLAVVQSPRQHQPNTLSLHLLAVPSQQATRARPKSSNVDVQQVPIVGWEGQMLEEVMAR